MADNFKNFYNGINYRPLSSDPTNPKEGDVFRADGTIRTEGLWEYVSGAWRAVTAAISGDIGGDSFTVESGAKLLATNHLHSASDFPDTTGLYGWHLNATGAWGDEDWNGGVALTEVGAIGTATDFRGTANAYIDFDGTNDAVYASSTAFDTANESFSVGGWFKLDTDNNGYLICKSEADNTDASFYIQVTGGLLNCLVYYNNSGGFSRFFPSYKEFGDNNWHHIVFVYDQANTSIALYMDGKCVAYNVDSNLATRNNGTTSELTFGGCYDTSVGLTSPFDGKICETFYKKDVLTANEVRKVFAAGSQRMVSEATSNLSGESKVSVLDGRPFSVAATTLPNSDYTVTTSAADATGFIQYIPESGLYSVEMNCFVFLEDADSTTAICYPYLYDGSAIIPGTRCYMSLTADANAEAIYMPLTITTTHYFTKDTYVSLRIAMDSGDNIIVKGSIGGSLTIKKLD